MIEPIGSTPPLPLSQEIIGQLNPEHVAQLIELYDDIEEANSIIGNPRSSTAAKEAAEKTKMQASRLLILLSNRLNAGTSHHIWASRS
jgi:hypothetical protein